MPKWYASIPAAHPSDPPRTLIVECDDEATARAYAVKELGEAGLIVQQTGDDARADIRITKERADG
jgi:hypothetical protein